MNIRKIELHISQVQRAIDQCLSKFPENKKQENYDNLGALFNAIKQTDFSKYEGEFFNQFLNNTRLLLNRIFHSIEHLHYDDVGEVPVELIKPLDLVIGEWFEKPDDYFVCISYNNRFYIDALQESERIQYDGFCRGLFNVAYNQSLILISKPKFLANDFLASIPVYHELGHFIDYNFGITESIDNDDDYRPDLKDDKREQHIII